MTQKTDKNSKSVPTVGTDKTQVIDIIESGRSHRRNDLALKTSTEVLGSVMSMRRITQFNDATLTIDMARVQDAYNGQGDMVLDTEAKTFKEFVEVSGHVYKTILDKIGRLRKSTPEIYELFDRLNVPVKTYNQFNKLPKGAKENALALLADPVNQSNEQALKVIRDVVEAFIIVEDRNNESAIKAKSDLIKERDELAGFIESLENTRQNLVESLEKERSKTKKLDAELNPESSAVALLKICSSIKAYLKLPEQADDPAQQTANLKFKELIMRWEERLLS